MDARDGNGLGDGGDFIMGGGVGIFKPPPPNISPVQSSKRNAPVSEFRTLLSEMLCSMLMLLYEKILFTAFFLFWGVGRTDRDV